MSFSCHESTAEATALFTHSSLPSLKRVVDVALALVLSVVTAPMLIGAVALVRLSSAGPVLYIQTRSGKGGRRFTIYKVRTMHHDCERHTGPQWSSENDPRVFAVGRLLRRSHIDELPQLWNVLRGDMSLVGPRPERPEFVDQLEKAVPRYAERLAVLPGVTGLAQVILPPDSDLDSVRRKLTYDLYYVDVVGIGFDARIMLGTALYLLGVPRASAARLLGLYPAPAAGDEGVARPIDVAQGIELVAQGVSAWRDS